MNKNQLIILAGILGVLIFLAVLKKSSPIQELHEQETESLEIIVNANDLSGMTINKGNEADPILLMREASIWRINSLWNVRANEEKINRLIDEINALRGELRSNSEDLFGDYGITDDEGLHIDLHLGEDPTLHIVVGLESPNWQNIFIREASKPAVYLANSDLLSVMGLFNLKTDKLDVNKWIDLALFHFETADAAMVSINEINLWENLPFDSAQEKITKYLNGLRNLRGTEVVDPEAGEYGLDAPAWKLKLTFDDGTEHILNVAILEEEESNKHYVRFDDNPEVFTVAAYVLSRINVARSTFIKDDPLSMGTGNPSTVSVETPEKQISINLDESETQSDELKAYIKDLTEFSVKDADGSSEVSVEMPNRLHIVYKEKEAITITCESFSDAIPDSVNCKQHDQIPFAIMKSTFEALFKNLSRLEKESLVDSQADTLIEVAP